MTCIRTILLLSNRTWISCMDFCLVRILMRWMRLFRKPGIHDMRRLECREGTSGRLRL